MHPDQIEQACSKGHCIHRSGLRGAVGLALSLFVFLDEAIADERFRVLTFFYIGTQAFLTLMLQGTTMPTLLRVRMLTHPLTLALFFKIHVHPITELAFRFSMTMWYTDHTLISDALICITR